MLSQAGIILLGVLTVFGVLSASPQNSHGEQLVYTMKGEYQIVPDADGRSYSLRRLDTHGQVYETITVNKKGEKSGDIVYVDSTGKSYTQLSDGRLQEILALDGAPVVQTPQKASAGGPGSGLRLMTSPPVLPRSANGNALKSGNITLPAGEQPLRSSGGLLYMNTGVDQQGHRREVVVQKVADRWFVRTSVSEDPNDAPAFKIEDDGTISGYRQLPATVPQVKAIDKGDTSVSSEQIAATQAAHTELQPRDRRVEYQDRKGTIFSRPDGKVQRTYINLDGDQDSLELEPVRGLGNLFTPRGNSDVTVVVDKQGHVTATDIGGRAVALTGTRNSILPRAVQSLRNPAASGLNSSSNSPAKPRETRARIYSEFEFRRTGQDEITISAEEASGAKLSIRCKPARDASGRISDDECLAGDKDGSTELYVRTLLPGGRQILSVIYLGTPGQNVP